MRAVIMVKDKRTYNGLNSRGKNCDTIEDCKKFALSLKNRASNHVTVINGTKVFSVPLF